MTPVPVRSLTVMVSAPPRALKLIPSTPLRSMVTLPTSRKNRTRLPLAERSMFSLALEPLNCIVSVPSWPSTVSLPSPGFHTKVSSPAPMKATSLPRPPMIEVVAVAADQHVVAVAADDLVVAGAAVHRQLDHAGGQRGRVDGVVAAQSVDDELVVGALGAADRHSGRQAGHLEAGPAPAIWTLSALFGAVDDDGVGLAVAGAAAGRAREVEVDAGDAGAGQVVDGDGVGAAQGVDVDLLDAVDVHGRCCRRRG